MSDKYTDIVSRYIDIPVDYIEEIIGGHINQSLLVTAGGNKYVLQCLSPAIAVESLRDLESNYLAYKAACEEYTYAADSSPCGWECPEWLTDRSGQFLHTDVEGKTWRLYRHIAGDAIKSGEPYEAGMGLGRMHKILKNCNPGGIHSVFPNLHDLKHYYDEYLSIENAAVKRDPSLEDVIARDIDKLLGTDKLTDTVIHGDAKISNMIMRNGHVVGLIDLDTIMKGSVYDDIADCLRSCCMDENYELIQDQFASMLRGYGDGSGMEITYDVIKTAKLNLTKNIFMLGLRYYTDYLKGNKYFRESTPGDNLKKARKLLLHTMNV